MAWFFVNENIETNEYLIEGENAHHISKSLRMKIGEELTLCSPNGKRYECAISSFNKDSVEVKILSSTICEQEADVKLSLFMSLVKGDKMEDVIQKSVELGVYEITPTLTKRCISRPDEKSINKKIERWQKISDNAASQSRRGIIPKVNPLVDIENIDVNKFDKVIVFYECGGEKIKDIIKSDDKNIAIIIGSEGGFEEEEIKSLKEKGAFVGTLGKRILRAQTAPLCAITSIMYETGNLN